MKNFLLSIAIVAAIGCASVTAYKTLASIEYSVDGAYKGFMDGIVKGAFKTNDLPTIARDYNTFQSAFRQALIFAKFNTNSIAPESLVSSGTALVSSITTSESK